MNTSKLEEKDIKRILSLIDRDYCEHIDTIAVSYALAAGIENPDARYERDIKYSAIKSTLPGIFTELDIDRSTVNEDSAADIVGRIYTNYLMNKFQAAGLAAKKDDGHYEISGRAADALPKLCKGEIRLDEAI